MKKHDLKTLALMGLTGGLLLGQQGSANAANNAQFQETPWETLGQHKCNGPNGCPGAKVLSQHKCNGTGGCGGLNAKCNGHGGCGGLTAVRDQSSSPDDQYESPEPSKGSGQQKGQKQDSDPNGGNMGYHLMTEQELLIELNDEGVRMYNSLDEEGKALARKVASMRCNQTNECKGLNACMTAKNSCAGKGECRGKGKCAVSDKNLAVKLVYDKMAAKRAKMQEAK